MVRRLISIVLSALLGLTASSVSLAGENDSHRGFVAQRGLAILYGRVLHPPFQVFFAGDTLCLASAGRVYPVQPSLRIAALRGPTDPKRRAEHDAVQRALQRARNQDSADQRKEVGQREEEQSALFRSSLLQDELLEESLVQGLLTKDAYFECLREARRNFLLYRDRASGGEEPDQRQILANTLLDRAQRRPIPDRGFFVVFESGVALGVEEQLGREVSAGEKAPRADPHERLRRLQRHLEEDGALIVGKKGVVMFFAGERAAALRRALAVPEELARAFPPWLAEELTAPASLEHFQELRP